MGVEEEKFFLQLVWRFDVGVGQHTKEQMSKAEVKTCVLRWFKIF